MGMDQMWHSLRSLLEETWQHATRRDACVAFLFLFALAACSVFSLKNDPLFLDYKVLWYSVILILYFTAIAPPVARLAAERHRHVLQVVLWGLISLTVTLVAFYLFFFALAETKDQQEQWERVLNLPPVIAGAVAAAIGWYAAHQFAAKNHRTNNSFQLVMQTRCNTEFVKHARKFLIAYPSSSSIPMQDSKYFDPSARSRLEEMKRKQKAEQLTEAETTELKQFAEEKLEGIEGARYLLNFYEFMSFGIYAGDLDEELLYETISPAVVKIYEQSTALRAVLNGPDGDVLAFQHLERLVSGYERKSHSGTEKVLGWRARLAQERVSFAQ